MHSHTSLNCSSISRLGMVLLVFLLVGCGSNSGTVTQNPSIPTTIPTSITPTLAPTNPAINDGLAFDVGGLLHIQSDGIDCTPDWPRSDGGSLRAIVLATDRLTYDSGETQQMTTYVDNIFSASGSGKRYPPSIATLQFVPMSISANLNKARDSGYDPGCRGFLEITNIGQTSLQIDQLDLRLVADVQPNNNYYRLINVCSLSLTRYKHDFCPPSGFGAGGLIYPYDFQLDTGSAGTMFQGLAEGGALSPTLRPGELASTEFFFHSPDNRIYSLLPEVTVSTSGVQQTFTLSPLPLTLDFADPSHVSCYTLQGHTFIQQDIKKTFKEHSWCL